MNNKLFILATPIGNLNDISKRAIETLAFVDIILCEDTRVTKQLLNALEIKTATMSFHQHSKLQKMDKIVEMLRIGKNIALVTDRGTPGISDPGGKLVEYVLSVLPEAAITPIPGPAAHASALSISGFPSDNFIFLGFPPHKKGRNKFFNELADEKKTVVFFGSTHRIMKTMKDLEDRIENRRVVVCRELTKIHETIYRGTASEVTEELKSTSIKGEFTIVIAPQL